jgi:hypothetical protein
MHRRWRFVHADSGTCVQLNGVAFKALQTALAKAPWGYHLQGAQAMKDWRSWHAFLNETYCLASIFLQQSFPKDMCARCTPPDACWLGGVDRQCAANCQCCCACAESFHLAIACAVSPRPYCRSATLKEVFKNRLEKEVKAPELPKRTVELLPLPSSGGDPQAPPVSYTLRTVLFVDCVGSEPLRVYAVPVEAKQGIAAIKTLVRQAAMPNQVRYAFSRPMHRGGVVWQRAAVASVWCVRVDSSRGAWQCLSRQPLGSQRRGTTARICRSWERARCSSWAARTTAARSARTRPRRRLASTTAATPPARGQATTSTPRGRWCAGARALRRRLSSTTSTPSATSCTSAFCRTR